MRKTAIVEIPNTYAKKPTISELILLSLAEPRSSIQVMRQVKVSGNTLRPILSSLVAEGKIKVSKCPHCDIGVMYKK